MGNRRECKIVKRIFAFLVMFVLVLTSLGLTGCGGGKSQSGSQQTAGTSQPAKDESILSLLGKGKQIEGMSYDYSLTTKEITMNGRVWMQGNKFKTEAMAEGRKMITIFDGDTIYSYDPEQNTAMKLSAINNKQVETPLDYSRDIESKPDIYKIIETAFYDGAKCKVIVLTSGDGKEQVKMWIHEDYGIPVRVESASADGGKIVMEYKNLKVGPQSPDTFKLPAGVQVTDMNEMLKNIPQMPVSKP